MENKQTEVIEKNLKGLFKKYISLTNHYQEVVINKILTHHPRFLKEKYVVQEKIHGANFQIGVTKDGVHYGSRNNLLGTDRTKVGFFGFQGIADQYIEVEEAIRNYIIGTTGIEKVIIYGEFFGPGIQAIDYGIGGKRIKFFDMSIDGKMISQREFLAIMRRMDMEHHLVPIELEGVTLDEALAFANDGGSNYKEETIREGNVIKPMGDAYYTEDSLFYIKNKNDKFTERGPVKPKVTNTRVEFVQNLFKSYLTENRLNNVISKEGKPEGKKDVGKFIKLLTQDAFEDFIKDYPEMKDEPNISRTCGKVGGSCALLILKMI